MSGTIPEQARPKFQRSRASGQSPRFYAGPGWHFLVAMSGGPVRRGPGQSGATNGETAGPQPAEKHPEAGSESKFPESFLGLEGEETRRKDWVTALGTRTQELRKKNPS